MRSFKVVKGKQQSRRNVQSLRLSIPENPLSSSFVVTATTWTAPVNSIENRKLLPVMNGQVELAHAFETLVKRWPAGAGSVSRFLQHPSFSQWSKRSSVDQGPVVFCLIAALVPSEEQFDLCKEFLEEDLLAQRQNDYPYYRWRDYWDDILRCEDYEDARELLYEDDSAISQLAGDGAGDKFLSCALVIVAEHQLRDCRNRIEYPDKFVRPLLRSCDLGFCNNHEYTQYCGAHAEHYPPQMKYIDILRDFRHLHHTVDASFYKYALELVEWNVGSTKPEEKSIAMADEYRRRYLQLVNHYKGVRARAARNGTGSRGPLVAQTSPTADSVASTNTLSTSERPSTGDSNSGFHVSTNIAFEILLSKWKSLDDFNEYACSLLSLDGWGISIFEISAAGNENLFSIIRSSLPKEEQIQLVRALLDAFANVTLTPDFSPWGLSWWCSVYSSTSWDKFLTRLDPEKIGKHLERVMGAEGSKLFGDAVVLLVGERLLLDLKTQLVVLRADAQYLSSKAYQKFSGQYIAILRGMQMRGLPIDQSWLNYHLSIM